MPPRLPWFAGLAVGLSACGNPMNLTYDFGRAFYASATTQADLSRTSALAAQYRLNGIEGADIRLRAKETTTDAEDAEATFDADNK